MFGNGFKGRSSMHSVCGERAVIISGGNYPIISFMVIVDVLIL